MWFSNTGSGGVSLAAECYSLSPINVARFTEILAVADYGLNLKAGMKSDRTVSPHRVYHTAVLKHDNSAFSHKDIRLLFLFQDISSPPRILPRHLYYRRQRIGRLFYLITQIIF